MESRDRRFDGQFFVAVATTRIYCRPSCPSPMPKACNLRVFPSTAAAQQAGYRACRRCLPDAAPGSPDWDVRADVAGRAMRLIAAGTVDREGVGGLARRLGYSERQLHRHLVAALGAGAQQLARAQRVHTARLLLQSTRLTVTEVAFASGFASIRQLNETVRQVYGATPTALRAAAGGAATPGEEGLISLKLAYRPPLAAGALFGFLAERAVPGLEEGSDRYHRRALCLPYGTGVATLRDAGGHVDAELRLTTLRDLPPAVQHCRTLLDLDADPAEIDGALARDALLAPLVTARPGLRAPGHAGSQEAAVRAVLEADLGAEGGREAAHRLVERYGVPLPEPVGTVTRAFPATERLAVATDAGGAGLPPASWATVRALATALATGAVRLDPGADRAEAQRTLRAVPGVTPAVAAHIRMRALHDPDVPLVRDTDLTWCVASRTVGWAPDGFGHRSDAWRPYRSYAHHHLRAARTAAPMGRTGASGQGTGAPGEGAEACAVT